MSLSDPSLWQLSGTATTSSLTQFRSLPTNSFVFFPKTPHPSLGFAQKGGVWTAEVGRGYRAIARRRGDDYFWFWIGSHEKYKKLLKRVK